LIKTRIAILVSGRGSNMQRLVETCEQQLPSVEIVLVASNKPCAGIDFAAARGLPTALINRQTHDSRQAQETALAKTIEAAAADWIFLAGYMAVLSADFVGRFTGRILNIHPSLLPAFKGLDTHQRALDAGVSQHGASVHIVTAALDDGPVILQAGLKIGEDETAETLAERVLRLEHHLLPFVLASLATGKLTLSNAVPHWVARTEIFATVDAVTRDFLEDHAIWPG
jgi:phosphoribosylglycinamide formyltransferase-1